MEFFVHHPHAGALVTVDGPNGSGKSSLTRDLARDLERAGVPTHVTSQPSRSALGSLARSGEDGMRGRSLACLVAADRHHQLAAEIEPRLIAGEVVLVDRYVESSLVLQQLDGVEEDFVLAINNGVVRPDLRILLSTDAATIRRRLAERDHATRLEREHDVQRELDLYERADALLAAEGAPSLGLDSGSDPALLVATATDAVLEVLRRRSEAAAERR